MSKLMREFLSAYLEWVEAGAPQSDPFERELGLCSNADRYPGVVAIGELDHELGQLFARSGLNEVYPFGEARYWEDFAAEAQHLNEQRLAWIREQLNPF
ncbi:hypothetical protein [Burkholderia cenocepacia]|uniref:hypothetical protein n=1 Tax=Burkholderia cenocepacia TaxID=95486 RepID=UPI0024B819D5|nr:hypothetical protein [Burkholderia cenocepacia]MDI9686588.1 hypothetical protein [Burkholderia cenocepacia]